MKAQSPYRSPKFIIFISILSLLLIAGVTFFIINYNRKKRAKKVSEILDACAADPNCNVDKKGNVNTGSTTGGTKPTTAPGRQLNPNQTTSLAKNLVDDIWGYTFKTTDSYWKDLTDLLDVDFKEVVKEATRYIKQEKKKSSSDEKNFKELVQQEDCAFSHFCSKRDEILNRMMKLGIE